MRCGVIDQSTNQNGYTSTYEKLVQTCSGKGCGVLDQSNNQNEYTSTYEKLVQTCSEIGYDVSWTNKKLVQTCSGMGCDVIQSTPPPYNDSNLLNLLLRYIIMRINPYKNNQMRNYIKNPLKSSSSPLKSSSK
jgi:hypothetical protein